MRYYQATSQPYVSQYVGNKYNPYLYLKAASVLEDRLNQAEAANAKFQDTGELTPGRFTSQSGEAEALNQKIRAAKQAAQAAALAGKTKDLTDAIYKGQALLNSPEAQRIKQDFEYTQKVAPLLMEKGPKRNVKGDFIYQPGSQITPELYQLNYDVYQDEVTSWGKNFFRPDKIKEYAPYVEEATDSEGNIIYKKGQNLISYEDASKEAFTNALVPTVDTWGPDLNNYADFTGLAYRQYDQYKDYSAEKGSANNPEHPEWSEKQQAAFNDAAAYMEPLYQEIRTVGSTQSIKPVGAEKKGTEKLNSLLSLIGVAHTTLTAPKMSEAIISAVGDKGVGNNVGIVNETIQGLVDTPVSMGERTISSQDFYNKILNTSEGQTIVAGQITSETEDFLKALWVSPAPFDYTIAREQFLNTASEATANMEQAMTYNTIKEDVIAAQRNKTPEWFDSNGEFKNPITKEEELQLRKNHTVKGKQSPSPGETKGGYDPKKYPEPDKFNQEAFNKSYNELLAKKNPALKATNEQLETAFGNYSDYVVNSWSVLDFPKADGGSIDAQRFSNEINTRDFLTSGKGGFDLTDFNSMQPINISENADYKDKTVKFDPETIYLNDKGKWMVSGTLYDDTDKANPAILNEHVIGNVSNVLKMPPELEIMGKMYGKIKHPLHALKEGSSFDFTANGHKVTIKKGAKTGLEDKVYYSIDDSPFYTEDAILDAADVIGRLVYGASGEVAPGGKSQVSILH